MKRLLTLTTLLILTACTAPGTASLTTTPTSNIPSPQFTDQQLPAVYPAAPPPGAVAQLGYGAVFVKYVSPDGQNLAVGTASGVGLYHLPDLEMIWFTPTDFTVNALAWSPDSTQIVVSTVNARRPYGALIDAQTGRIQHKIIEHRLEITSIDWTRDSKLFLTGGCDGVLLVWDAASGQILHRLVAVWEDTEDGELYHSDERNTSDDNYSSFNADGSLIASYFYTIGIDPTPYNFFIVWDTATGEQLYQHTQKDYVHSITWHPDDPELLLVITPMVYWSKYDASIYNAVSREKLIQTEFPGDPFTSPKGYWSPDGSLIYFIGRPENFLDDKLTIRDASTLSPLYEIPYPAHYSHEIIFIDDLMFTIEADLYWTEVHPHLWDSRTGEEVDNWNNIIFDAYQDNLLYGSDQSTGEEILLELPTKTFIDRQAIQAINGQWRSSSVAWSSDGSQLAAGHLQGMTLWDVNSHAPLYNCWAELYGVWSIGSVSSVDERSGPALAKVAWGNDMWVIASNTLSEPIGQIVPTLMLWTPTGLEQYLVPGELRAIRDIAVSPDGSLIAINGDRTVWLNVTTKEFNIGDLAAFQESNEWAGQIKFSSDGRYVIGSDWTFSTLVFWDIKTGKIVRNIQPDDYSYIDSADKFDDELPTVTFLLDTQLITFAVPGGEVVEQLDLPPYSDNGLPYKITSVAVRDNILAIAYSLEPSYSDLPPADYPGDPIVLWDLTSGQLIQSYSGHNSRIVDLEFSPNGNLLASTSFDGVVIIWPVP